MPSPLAIAILPMRADAITRAEREAIRIIAARAEKLEAAGWDLNVAAPYPNSMKSTREGYKAALRVRGGYEQITESTLTARSMKDPNIVRLNQTRINKFINACKDSAAAQYDTFVAKLEGKVGLHTAACISGNHVWGHSDLTVTLPDGSTQCWRTQQIVNVSSLGLLFNQWPSRKVK